MKRHTLLILLAATFASAQSPLIQRRNEIEHTHGVKNDPGQLTYSLGQSPDSATLRVGTAVVTDPYTIRLTPIRILADDEWYAEYDSGISLDAAGRSVFYDGTVAETQIANGTSRSITVRPVNPALRISSASGEWEVTGNVHTKVEISETKAIITGTIIHQPPLPAPGKNANPLGIFSNIAVRVYASDIRDATTDLTINRATIIDDQGKIELGKLRTWTTQRYDWQTAPHWAEFPANKDVNLDRHQLRFDAGGTFRMRWLGADVWALHSYGMPIMRIRQGASDGQQTLEGFEIVAMDIDDDAGIAYIWVSEGPWGESTIQITSDLNQPSWAFALGQTSTFPAAETKNGRQSIKITVPIPGGWDEIFFRAAATLPENRNEVSWENADFITTTTAREIRLPKPAPAHAHDTGTPGEVRYTDSYIYYCIAPDTWVRAALSIWGPPP